VRGILEELVSEGKIRFYGWSTNDSERSRFFAQGGHCAAIQFRLNVLEDAPKLLDICDEYDQAGIIRGPLASGFLTGKYTPDNLDDLLSADDFRLNYRGDLSKVVKGSAAIEDVLQSDGRTLVQGSLAWIWARSNRTIPIPGFRMMGQVEENIKAMEFGPLRKEQMSQIDDILGDIR
jgi:aryl-alcohol dehydrogenase-like predicted oxidoreductase